MRCAIVFLPLLLLVQERWPMLVTGAPNLNKAEEVVVSRFQEYLRMDTVHPFPNYFPVTEFLVKQAKEIGLDINVIELAQKKPVVLMTWEGSEPDLPSILLNSHTDVVPADESKWTYPPLSAHIDSEGKIFARGVQDMKCVGMQYLEAVRSLKAEGFKPKRSLHISFLPDEEIGGDDGALRFYESQQFLDLNVAIVMDEGLASLDDNYRVSYGERSAWWFYLTAYGSPAHGSRMIDGMAVENLRISLEKIAQFRSAEFAKVKAGLAVEGEVVSINNVYLKAGTATPNGFVMNLQPSEAEAGFDMRVPPLVNVEALERLINEEWAPASRNITARFLQKGGVLNKKGEPALSVADDSNPWWVLFKEAVAKAGGNLASPEIFVASTDARFVRYQCIPAFGFSPMANTPVLLHEHNEFLNVKEYLKGIKVYEELIKAFTSANEQGTADSPDSVKGSAGAFVEPVHTEL